MEKSQIKCNMKIQENKIDKYILWLLIISVLVRGFLAAFIEFGNDEVYYWTYAMYPDWSHFDHPGMVGWVMQIFSLNLLFTSEFALRLSSIIFMTIDTYITMLINVFMRVLYQKTDGRFDAIRKCSLDLLPAA